MQNWKLWGKKRTTTQNKIWSCSFSYAWCRQAFPWNLSEQLIHGKNWVYLLSTDEFELDLF